MKHPSPVTLSRIGTELYMDIMDNFANSPTREVNPDRLIKHVFEMWHRLQPEDFAVAVEHYQLQSKPKLELLRALENLGYRPDPKLIWQKRRFHRRRLIRFHLLRFGADEWLLIAQSVMSEQQREDLDELYLQRQEQFLKKR